MNKNKVIKPEGRRYIIRSVYREEPNCYFAAIHSFTPFYGDAANAQPFATIADAEAYAEAELFTDDRAYEVEPAPAANERPAKRS